MTVKDKWIKLPGQKQVKYASNNGKPVHQKLGKYKGKKNPKEYVDEGNVINGIDVEAEYE